MLRDTRMQTCTRLRVMANHLQGRGISLQQKVLMHMRCKRGETKIYKTVERFSVSGKEDVKAGEENMKTKFSVSYFDQCIQKQY